MEALVRWLDVTGVARAASGSAYAWINNMHLLGLVMLIGAIGVVDLRIAGLWRSLPLPALSRALTPVGVIGLAILIGSGALLFAADAPALVRSDTFGRKLVLILLAIANALMFRLAWRRGVPIEPPMTARIMAAASVLLWLAVALHGRMIAYS